MPHGVSVYLGFVLCSFKSLCLLIGVFWSFMINVIIEMFNVVGRKIVLKDIQPLRTCEYDTLHSKRL